MCAAPEDEDSDIKTDICRVDVDDEGNATITTNLTGCLGALYPAKFVKSDEGELDIIIPSVQSGKFSDANICRAVMEGEDDTSLHFENECSILKFYVDESIGVKSIEIINSGWDDIASGSRTITVEAPEDKTLYDVMPSEGQDRRICYVALDCAKDRVRANELTFKTETTTQGPVTRIPTESSYLQVGYMYNVFLPYYIEVNDQKWAYCNVGAFLPEEPGYYFSWGNTQGYVYDGQNWVSAPGGQTVLGGGFTEENYAGTTGSSISGRSLKVDVTEDAACAAWGGKWRIPTSQEYQNLFNACVGVDGYDTATKPTTGTPSAKGVYWCDSYDGVAGCLFCDVTCKLFFPAAGEGEDTSLLGLGSGGIYWSNTLCTSNTDYAYALGFESGIYPQNKTDRYYGIPIRPIYVAPAPTPTAPAYVEITAKYDGEDKPERTLKWYRQNLAITDSGNKPWKGDNTSGAVKVPGTNEDAKVGDYFQWAASYGGYNVTENQEPDSLLIYTLFTNTGCGDDKNEFAFIDSKQFNLANAPYGGTSYTKYTSSGEPTLEPSDDVASIILGGTWRMPTSVEFKALKDATYWKWEDGGYYVYDPQSDDAGKINDNGTGTYDKSNALLFFPAAGYGNFTGLNYAGTCGGYWSSTFKSSGMTNYAYRIEFNSDDVNPQYEGIRSYGFSVRPVSD